MPDDAALLSRYAANRDPDAFAAMVHQYAGLVYSAALRMTGNQHDAEDVAQDCFLQLARHAGAITTSVPAWLHATAVNRGRDTIRSAATRRRHEAKVTVDRPLVDASWNELAPYIDTAIAELPDDLRIPLIRHYLQGQSQTQIAADLQLNQATISRRIATALDTLRSKLGRMTCLSIGPALLTGALLDLSATTPLPTSLADTLAKMGIAGPPVTRTPKLAAHLMPKAKLAIGITGLVLLGGVLLIALQLFGHAKEKTTMSTTGPASILLTDVPPGHAGNWEVVGLETILHYLSPAARTALPYERLMGLSGMAFITQVQDDLLVPGWWPRDSWGFYSRIDFLSRAIGWQLRHVPEVEAEFRANPAAYYQQHFAPEVRSSLAAGKPLLGRHDSAFLILGYDDPNGPPYGRVTCDDIARTYRLDGEPSYPWGLLVFDHPIAPLDSAEADREALRSAVALGDDAASAASPSPHFTTGQKSYRVWADLLRDRAQRTQPRDHDTMLLQLRLNRQAAIAFCRDLATRYPGQPAMHLSAAADLYQQLVTEAQNAATTGKASSTQACDQLADAVDRMASLDAQAVDELRAAVEGLK